MNLLLLHELVAVAQHGGFGRAARALGVSQPLLTRHIRTLEAEIGARLLERGPRGAVLTDAGRRFLPRAQSILTEMELAQQELGTIATGREPVRVGVSPNFLFEDLGEALDRLAADWPQAQVQVWTDTREGLLAKLAEGDLDVVLALAPDYTLTPRADIEQFDIRALGTERICAFAPQGHALHAAPTLAEAADHPWIVPFQLSVTYRFESAFFRRGLAPPVQRLNTASLSFAQAAALRRGLPILLPEPLGRVEPLRPLALPELSFDYHCLLAARAGRRLPPACAALVDMLTELGAARPSVQV